MMSPELVVNSLGKKKKDLGITVDSSMKRLVQCD